MNVAGCVKRCTHVSDSRRAPSATLRESLYAKACDFSVLTALLPGIDAARAELGSLVGVESPVDGSEDAEGDSMENDVSVTSGPDAHVYAGWALHNLRGGGRVLVVKKKGKRRASHFIFLRIVPRPNSVRRARQKCIIPYLVVCSGPHAILPDPCGVFRPSPAETSLALTFWVVNFILISQKSIQSVMSHPIFLPPPCPVRCAYLGYSGFCMLSSGGLSTTKQTETVCKSQMRGELFPFLH